MNVQNREKNKSIKKIQPSREEKKQSPKSWETLGILGFKCFLWTAHPMETMGLKLRPSLEKAAPKDQIPALGGSSGIGKGPIQAAKGTEFWKHRAATSQQFPP